MVDSVNTIGPGWRATSDNGDVITDGVLFYFLSGTTTPLEVFSDANLSVSLGTSVACNSGGYPVSSGNAKVLVHVGVSPYKIRLVSTTLGTVWEHDGVKVALDTSDFLTTAAVADKPVTPSAVDRTLLVSDKGTIFNFNTTAGTLTATVPAPNVVGAGWWAAVAHGGTSNALRVISDGLATFRLNGVDVTSFSLTSRGQTAYIATDGTNYFVDIRTPGLIEGGPGIIKIVSRTNTPPGSPAAGDRHILTAAPAGAWSSFAQHDIVEANGFGGWFRYTPPTDAGWVAYVQAEDLYYTFRASAWISEQDISGRVIQRVYVESTSFSTTTVFPDDGTTPQSTEGGEVLTANITPRSATNRIRATFTGAFETNQSGAQRGGAGLFNGGASAIAVTGFSQVDTGWAINAALQHEFVGGVTTAITCSIRAGMSSAGTLSLTNNFGSTAQKASLVLEEITV